MVVMPKKINTKKNWFQDDGKWYNFEEQIYGSGDTIVIVRGPTKYRGNFTRKQVGKFGIRESTVWEVNRDTIWQDENPENWLPWQSLARMYWHKKGNNEEDLLFRNRRGRR
jgi:hypothetical protein